MNAEIDNAWAAGFIDGEGSFVITPQRNVFKAFLSVEQLVPEPLYKLQNLYGGNVGKRGTRRTYQYRCSTKQLEFLVKAIRPYLVVKNEDADIVLEFRSLVGKRGGAKLEPDVRNKMLSLRESLKQVHQKNRERV